MMTEMERATAEAMSQWERAFARVAEPYDENQRAALHDLLRLAALGELANGAGPMDFLPWMLGRVVPLRMAPAETSQPRKRWWFS